MSHTSRTFWNLSNHPLDAGWPQTQITAAETWCPGQTLALRDLPFPNVDPWATTSEVATLADGVVERLCEAGGLAGEPVMLMGEFSLTVALVSRLRARGFVPLTATTLREAQEMPQADGSRILQHRFRFVQFRIYPE